MPSSVSPARRALFDALAASADLSAVQVTFGEPDAHEEQEVVAMLGVGDVDEESAALGNERREERYRIDVGVKVHDPAGDSRSVDTRCFAYADAVRAVVAANLTLGGTVRTAHVVSQRSDGAQAAEGGGWVCFNLLAIECHARIT